MVKVQKDKKTIKYWTFSNKVKSLKFLSKLQSEIQKNIKREKR